MKNWIPAIVMMVFIFVLSSMPGKIVNATIGQNNQIEISGHFIFFVILCVSFYKATKKISLSIFLTVAYAVFDELHQLFTLGRSCSIFDVGVDTFGAFISGILLWKLLPILPKKLRNLLVK